MKDSGQDGRQQERGEQGEARGRRIAVVDIGSQTVVLLVAEVGETGLLPVHQELAYTGLGFGGGRRSGSLERAAVQRTVDAVMSYGQRARQLGAEEVVVVATAAVRNADNQDLLLGPLNSAGLTARVLSGEQEARLTALAAARALPGIAGGAVVLDIGAGSTEIVKLGRVGTERQWSLALGAYRVSELWLPGDPPGGAALAAAQQGVEQELAPVVDALAEQSFLPLVGVGGTITSLASMLLRLPRYDSDRLTGARLELRALELLVRELAGESIEERGRRVGLAPPRAASILGGAIVLSKLMRLVGWEQVVVCDRGLRWGVVHEQVEQGER